MQTNRYYNKISAKEFSTYDSTKVVVRSKYGTVYHSYQKQASGFILDFYVLEKTANDSKTLFKMDELTQIKNDSTFMLCEPPLKMSGDSINRPEGVWFYANTQKPGVTSFSVDSIPLGGLSVTNKKLSMGIYQFTGKKLIKISNKQSADVFYAFNPSGFFYLPDPGFLYELADFRDIK
jgi:hypothetical protein